MLQFILLTDAVLGYQFMFRARMCRSLIFDRVGDWDQRTVHSCAKHKLITQFGSHKKGSGINGGVCIPSNE